MSLLLRSLILKSARQDIRITRYISNKRFQSNIPKKEDKINQNKKMPPSYEELMAEMEKNNSTKIEKDETVDKSKAL